MPFVFWVWAEEHLTIVWLGLKSQEVRRDLSASQFWAWHPWSLGGRGQWGGPRRWPPPGTCPPRCPGGPAPAPSWQAGPTASRLWPGTGSEIRLVVSSWNKHPYWVNLSKRRGKDGVFRQLAGLLREISLLTSFSRVWAALVRMGLSLVASSTLSLWITLLAAISSLISSQQPDKLSVTIVTT